jgi:hypothetical protein
MIPGLEKCTKWTQNVPDGHKIPKWPKDIPNGRKINQHFPISGPKNLPKLGFLVWKEAIWQPWNEPSIFIILPLLHQRRWNNKAADGEVDTSGKFGAIWSDFVRFHVLLLSGVHVMIKILGNICQFSAKKIHSFYLKKQMLWSFFCAEIDVILTSNRHFFSIFSGEFL